MIRAIRDVLTINRTWDRSRAWTRILRFAALLLLLALPLNSFAQAHLLRQRPFRATEDQRSGGDHIRDLRSNSNGDGTPDRLGDYVCFSGTIIAGPQTYRPGASFLRVRDIHCDMLVCGGAEALRLGNATAVDGRLRVAGGLRMLPAGCAQLQGGSIAEMPGCELQGIKPDTRPIPVDLREYCAGPARYAGHLIMIFGIPCFSQLTEDSGNLFCWAGDGCDSLVLYIDEDTGIRLPPPDYRCYTITGITVRMHVPSHISTEPEWCLAPRFKGDLVEHDCSSEARLTTWGNIKARYSDQPTIR